MDLRSCIFWWLGLGLSSVSLAGDIITYAEDRGRHQAIVVDHNVIATKDGAIDLNTREMLVIQHPQRKYSWVPLEHIQAAASGLDQLKQGLAHLPPEARQAMGYTPPKPAPVVRTETEGKTSVRGRTCTVVSILQDDIQVGSLCLAPASDLGISYGTSNTLKKGFQIMKSIQGQFGNFGGFTALDTELFRETLPVFIEIYGRNKEDKTRYELVSIKTGQVSDVLTIPPDYQKSDSPLDLMQHLPMSTK